MEKKSKLEAQAYLNLSVICLTNLAKKVHITTAFAYRLQFQQHHQSKIHKIESGLLRKLLRKLTGKQQSFLDDNFLIFKQDTYVMGPFH
jgi:hypothetical protein